MPLLGDIESPRYACNDEKRYFGNLQFHKAYFSTQLSLNTLLRRRAIPQILRHPGRIMVGG